MRVHWCHWFAAGTQHSLSLCSVVSGMIVTKRTAERLITTLSAAIMFSAFSVAALILALEPAEMHLPRWAAIVSYTVLIALAWTVIWLSAAHTGLYDDEAIAFATLVGAYAVWAASVLALMMQLFMWVYDASDTSVQATFANLVLVALVAQLSAVVHSIVYKNTNTIQNSSDADLKTLGLNSRNTACKPM